jgi:predicted dehydrogenase
MALEAGKHVMIEKPLAGTTADAQAIVSYAKEHGLAVSCAPPSMLHPGQRRLMQLVESKAIGDVCLVRITRSSMGPGSRPGAPTDFRWFYQAGAGGMSSMAGYGLMMATGVLGPVKSLTAMSCTSIPIRKMRSGPAAGEVVTSDVVDNNVLTLNFGDNRLGTMDTGYCSMATRGPVMELFGTEGVICAWGGDMATRIEIYQDDWQTDVAGWRDVDIPGLNGVWSLHPCTLLHLAEVVLDGKKLLTGPEQSAHVVEIVEKVSQAAAEKREVELTTSFNMLSSADLPLDEKGPNPFA